MLNSFIRATLLSGRTGTASNRPLVLLPALLLLTAVTLPADEVTKWNELANRLAMQSGLANSHPLFQTRALAMVHIAMHDAVNTVQRRSQCYAPCGPLSPGASPEAAAIRSAYTVLKEQLIRMEPFGFPPFLADVEAAYASSLALIPDGVPKTQGVNVGEAAAQRILSLRSADGAYLVPVVDPNYPQGTAPGEYRFTEPFTFAFETQWGTVTPFALDRSDRFMPKKPYRINSPQYTADYNEIKNLGGTISDRTDDQTQIAFFWAESSPLGWNRVARTVSAAANLSLWQNARLFALVNMALADGYIASFHAKYDYNFWRPITAIHEGNSDGNNDTVGDPGWTSLATTPPIPDHDSAHSVEGGAAAEVLALFFGNDNVNFRICSTNLPVGGCGQPAEVLRSYSSFSQAALDNGLSRIYIGYHFRRAVTEGIQHGQKIGHWTYQKYLRPVH